MCIAADFVFTRNRFQKRTLSNDAINWADRSGGLNDQVKALQEDSGPPGLFPTSFVVESTLQISLSWERPRVKHAGAKNRRDTMGQKQHL